MTTGILLIRWCSIQSSGYSPSELSYAQSRASILITCVNLYKAKGGGRISDEQLTVQQNNDNDVDNKNITTGGIK
jgi:hypothetical protein